jgi:hypothetical protein
MNTGKLSAIFTLDRAITVTGMLFGIPVALFLLAPLTFGD